MRDSLDSASFTRISVNSASWAAYWEVKVAGMCCTKMTAAGKSRVKPGAMRITVAGPPVEATKTTTGNRWSLAETGAGRGVGFGADAGFALPLAP